MSPNNHVLLTPNIKVYNIMAAKHQLMKNELPSHFLLLNHMNYQSKCNSAPLPNTITQTQTKYDYRV